MFELLRVAVYGKMEGEFSIFSASSMSSRSPVGGLLIMRLIVSFLLSFDFERLPDFRDWLLSPE